MNSGDKCHQCDGRLQVVNTVVIGQTRKRYLGCRRCGWRPRENVVTLPLVYSPARVATSSTDHTRSHFPSSNQSGK